MYYYNSSEKEKAKKVQLEKIYPGDLQKCGATLRGFCPFHNDTRKPNLFVYVKTNSWYCFACGQGGDSISFYMKYRNVGFKQAVKELANDL